MTMTSKVVPYKAGFGPFAPEVYRTPAPYPFRGVSEDDAIAGAQAAVQGRRRPAFGRVRRARAGAGRGRLHPDDARLPEAAPGAARPATGSSTSNDEVQTGCGRTGPVWAIEHYGVEPDLLVSGKTLGGGLPLAGVTGRAEVMDAVPPGGLGGTFGGNPRLVRRRDRDPRRARRAAAARRADRRAPARAAEAMAPEGSDVRGLGPMVAIELPEQTGERDDAASPRAAREQGLMLLSCGIYGNVIRILVPFTIARRGARARPRHPRGLPWRLTSRSRACARPTATSSPSTTST